MVKNLHAGVQYNDWKGNVAADNLDDCNKTLEHYLKNKNLLDKEDYIISISCNYSDIHGCTENLPVSVTVRTIKLENHENVKQDIDSDVEVPVKDIHVDMSLEEFFRCFKRFSIAFSR